MNISTAKPLAICQLDQQRHAEQIHALQMMAYQQEAELLGIQDFPPLRRSIADIRQQAAQYWGIWQTDQTSNLVAAIGLEALPDCSAGGAQCMLIASLVVAPEHQRQGLAKRLLTHLIHSQAHSAWQVSTAYQNHPARQLYQRCGFVEHSQFHLPLDGATPLHMVQMQRPAQVDSKIDDALASQ